MNHDEETATSHVLAYRDVGEARIGLLKLAELLSFSTKGFGDYHARNKQSFPGFCRQIRQRALHLARQSSSTSTDDAGKISEYRHREDGDDGQFPGKDQHRDERSGNDRDARKDVDDGIGQNELSARNIIGQSGLDVASLG